MNKTQTSLVVFVTLFVACILPVSFTSCTKEKIVTDTVTVIQRDTIVKTDTLIDIDTLYPAWKIIGDHINDGLWAYYPINGSVYDSSGNGHILELRNGAGLAHDMWGNSSSAINLDGALGFGVIQDGVNFKSDSFSVSMFILPRERSGLVFGKQDYSNGKGASFNLGFDNVFDGERIRYSIAQNISNICNEEANGSFKCQKNELLNTYAWYHTVITYKRDTMRLYINGKLIDETLNTANKMTMCSSAPFILGSWWNGDKNLFNGKIDKLRIYERALKPEEVDYLYKKN